MPAAFAVGCVFVVTTLIRFDPTPSADAPGGLLGNIELWHTLIALMLGGLFVWLVYQLAVFGTDRRVRRWTIAAILWLVFCSAAPFAVLAIE
jgi:hypothetical protein